MTTLKMAEKTLEVRNRLHNELHLSLLVVTELIAGIRSDESLYKGQESVRSVLVQADRCGRTKSSQDYLRPQHHGRLP
jgi:hypothetical protein